MASKAPPADDWTSSLKSVSLSSSPSSSSSTEEFCSVDSLKKCSKRGRAHRRAEPGRWTSKASPVARSRLCLARWCPRTIRSRCTWSTSWRSARTRSASGDSASSCRASHGETVDRRSDRALRTSSAWPRTRCTTYRWCTACVATRSRDTGSGGWWPARGARRLSRLDSEARRKLERRRTPARDVHRGGRRLERRLGRGPPLPPELVNYAVRVPSRHVQGVEAFHEAGQDGQGRTSANGKREARADF